MESNFQGFQESKKRFSSLPDQFFSELLPVIDDINELKITIYLLWSAYTQGDFGTSFSRKQIMLDKTFMDGLDTSEQEKENALVQSLQKAVQRGSILQVKGNADNNETVYFINSPRGKQAAELYAQDNALEFGSKPAPTLDVIQTNIFQLYEENIGPLTPIIADMLRDAQEIYPIEWVEEAIQLAVKNNVRRWKYVEAILTRWQEEGKDGANRRDDQEDYRRYLKGEYGDFGNY